MKICGIVAEYNPFHNGHKYQIEELKRKTNCDAIVAIMSGNFLQRGIPASFDKWTRAKMAVENGVDVVVELPTIYSTSSSEFFASGSIGILEKLNSISYLSFGAQNDNLDIYYRIADVLNEEPLEYKANLQKDLKKGLAFPVARANSLCDYLKKEINKKDLENFLLDPNNILGIEYIKALKKYNSSIEPAIIKRLGTAYNSEEFDETTNICSSTAIREKLKENDIDVLENYLPYSSFKNIKDSYLIGKPQMTLKNFEKEILYSLRKISKEDLKNISDVSDGIDNVILKAIKESFTLEDLVESLKSKRYTRTRIQRILIHILLNIKTDYLLEQKYTPQYARVLAISKNGKKVLSEISKNSQIPVVTNVAKFMKNATKEQKEMLDLDILSTNIYTLGYDIPNYRNLNLDYTMPIL